MRPSTLARALALLAASLVTATVAAAPSEAVSGGGYDGYDHNYVVGVIRPGSTNVTCSGVWITTPQGRQVVLTDAHCVATTAGSGIYVTFGPQYRSGGYAYWGRSYRHPAYDASTSVDDVAVIVLAHPPRWRSAQLAGVGASLGHASLTTVGFGDPHRGIRYHAVERVTSHTGSRVYLRWGSGNSCSRDSGGPDMIRGTAQVAALVDVGTCQWDNDTRVDTADIRSFVDTAGR